ncbi:arginine N-succinyltransferase [Sphingomonas sinipercae]|uniref:Arginine N-succinyltransferase n=1 Tax=Sphingomonas sinipercae TaxID=2714944 RepID=A0A6G7ZP66_9SPHN|nr:arginine N-succinyltransferase [Sphingomonas sinipercae]QIL02774.1 arginine N-succinyltransferase [Sphingomonas sinipercae]
MSCRIRAARESDVGALYKLAKLTGGGFTNLPAERKTLAEKLERSAQGFARESESPGDDLYVFMLEDFETKAIRGTCQVFGAVGTDRPFYSYLISTRTQKSAELNRVFHNQTLTLTTDLEGSSEVGGLFLHPQERAGGLGVLLARSRYLFIKAHRERFADTVLAELRGVMDERGNAPFWDALGGRFFGMSFPEADDFNAIHGTQFIADLFPTTPIYVSMLPESAREVIGQPHPTGRAALRMLENEGFEWDSYVDIFDGGPTVTASTDKIRAIRESTTITVAEGIREDGETMLLASGRLADFKACYGQVVRDGDSALVDPKALAMLEAGPGDRLLAVKR